MAKAVNSCRRWVGTSRIIHARGCNGKSAKSKKSNRQSDDAYRGARPCKHDWTINDDLDWVIATRSMIAAGATEMEKRITSVSKRTWRQKTATGAAVVQIPG